MVIGSMVVSTLWNSFVYYLGSWARKDNAKILTVAFLRGVVAKFDGHCLGKQEKICNYLLGTSEKSYNHNLQQVEKPYDYNLR